MSDFALSTVLDFDFQTAVFGVGSTLGGTPVVSVYKGNSTTQSTTGVTLTADFDGITGLNHVRVDTSADGMFYSAGGQFRLVVTTGTVGGASVAGFVIGNFSLEAVSSLRPTTAGRTLDVSSTGEAGIDWANIGSPTTTVGLSGTTIKTATDVETDTADIQTRLPAALTGDGNMKSDALKFDGNSPVQTTGKLWVLDGSGNPIAPSSDSSAIKAKTDQLAFTIANQVDSNALSGGGGSGLDAAGVRAAVGLASANLDTQLGAIDAKTAKLPADPAAVGDIPTAIENADAHLNRDMSAVSDTNARSPLNALRALRNKMSISGTTMTITKEDDATSAWTAALSTDAAAIPITGVDPA